MKNLFLSAICVGLLGAFTAAPAYAAKCSASCDWYTDKNGKKVHSVAFKTVKKNGDTNEPSTDIEPKGKNCQSTEGKALLKKLCDKNYGTGPDPEHCDPKKIEVHLVNNQLCKFDCETGEFVDKDCPGKDKLDGFLNDHGTGGYVTGSDRGFETNNVDRALGTLFNY